MTATKKQAEKLAYINKGGNITIRETNLSPADAKKLVDQLQDVLKNCNVATNLFKSIEDSLFYTATTGAVFTVNIESEAAFDEIKAALNIQKNHFVSIIGALMEYHSDQEALNIIINQSVFDTRSGQYRLFPLQLAQQLQKRTQTFLKIRLVQARDREVVGIFCRQSDFEISVSFRAQILDQLRKTGDVTVAKQSIPDTYLMYPATLTHYLRKRFPDRKLTLQKADANFRFYFEK